MIEINRKDSPYIYRQNEDDARIIDRRANQRNGRWHEWRLFATANEAKRALLALTKNSEGDGDDQTQ